MKHAPNGRGWRFWFAIGTAGTIFARLELHTHHRPQTTDVETRIDQVTKWAGSLVPSLFCSLSSSLCPTDCADQRLGAHFYTT